MLTRPWAATLIALCVFAPSAQGDNHTKQLFNGKDMTGWKHVGEGSFTVENGALKTEGGMGLLTYTEEKFGDAVIRVVYKPNSPQANSGVFIRIPDEPEDAWYAVHFGHEVQISDRGSELHRTGAIYTFAGAAKYPASPSGWNTLEIRLDGSKTTVTVNGKVVNEFDEAGEVPAGKPASGPRRGPRPDSGYIGLQNHDAESVVWFKEISVSPISK